MRIGIIGAGRLGSALGTRLAGIGREVMFGGGASAADAATAIGVRAGSNRSTAAFADVVVLAVPFAAISEALAQAGSLDGKLLWSCVNALKPDFSGLAVGFDTSAAEQVAAQASGARVVTAIPPFSEALAAGDLRYDADLIPTVFVCGDDGEGDVRCGGDRQPADRVGEPGDAPRNRAPRHAASCRVADAIAPRSLRRADRARRR